MSLKHLFSAPDAAGAEAFSMKIDAVFPAGQGVLATGIVAAGAIADGDTVYLTTVQGRAAACRVKLSLDRDRHPGAARAEKGMMAGLLLPGLRKDEVTEGLLLTGTPPDGAPEPEPEPDPADLRDPVNRAFLRGALWTAPVWLSVLAYTLGAALPAFRGALDRLDALSGVPAVLLYTLGSSMCFFAGLLLVKGAAGFLAAAKQALAAAAAVSGAYFISALVFFSAWEVKDHAQGGAFGLVSTTGALVASLMGAWARLLGRRFMGVFDPYSHKEKPPPGDGA